jgi:predicted amidohydrolase
MSDDAVGVAVAQFSPGTDLDANLSSMRALADRAVDRGADLIVFPEYSSYFSHPVDASFVAAAEPLDGAFVGGMSLIARELGIHMVAGMAERLAVSEKFSNTLVAVDPDGRLEATYRKQHLYDAFGASESRWVEAAEIEAPEVFTVDTLTVGLQTCYDLRFPEITRTIVDAGADVILVPSEWVRGPLKEKHWRVLVTARAIENTVYVAAADHTPPVGVGSSLIADPMGVELAALGEEADVAVAWMSTGRVGDVRRVNPALALRRYRVEPI